MRAERGKVQMLAASALVDHACFPVPASRHRVGGEQFHALYDGRRFRRTPRAGRHQARHRLVPVASRKAAPWRAAPGSLPLWLTPGTSAPHAFIP